MSISFKYFTEFHQDPFTKISPDVVESFFNQLENGTYEKGSGQLFPSKCQSGFCLVGILAIELYGKDIIDTPENDVYKMLNDDYNIVPTALWKFNDRNRSVSLKELGQVLQEYYNGNYK